MRAGHAHSQAGRRFRQGAAAGHPPGHRLCRSRLVPPADTGSGWPCDGHSGPLDRPDIPIEVTAQLMGLDPVRTAAAKRWTPPAPSVRPCAWPSGHGQLRGLYVLALTRQDGNAHACLGPTPAATSTGTPVMTICNRARCRNVRKRGPVRSPRGRVQRPRWTPRSDRFRTLPAPSYPAGHRPLHRHAMANRKRCGQGTDERHGRHSDVLDRHATKAARRAAEPSCGAEVRGLATKVGSSMARLPARP